MGSRAGRAPCLTSHAGPGAAACRTASVALLVLAGACGTAGPEGSPADTPHAASPPEVALPALAPCSDSQPPHIGSEGVGLVRLGASAASLSGCTRRDTSWSLEGTQERGWTVTVGGSPVLAVTAGDSVVTRVIVADRALRTAAGVGVGSTVAELRSAYGDYCAFPAEIGGVVAIFPELSGISFATTATIPTRGPMESLTLPDTAHVRQVLVHGATVRCMPRRA